MKSTTRILSILAACLLGATTHAQLFSEGFDSSAADVKVNAQADTASTFVDYSNISRGGTTYSVPEAPRMVAGSAATSGILLEANIVGDGAGTGAAAGINVLAGATPLSLSGSYRVSFDVFQHMEIDPFPGGSTEQMLWGVGSDNAGVVEARNTRADGTMGIWGWLAGENGYGTEDAAIFLNGDEITDLGDTNGENAPFDTAFEFNADGTVSTPDEVAPNGAPLNSWVRVDIDVLSNGDGTSDVLTYFNDVQFFGPDAPFGARITVPDASVTGAALFGYEDPFGSINSDPAGSFALYDNFVVTQVPEPNAGLMVLFGFAGLLMMNRRK